MSRFRMGFASGLAVLALAPAWAAAPSHGEEAHGHGPPWATLFFTVINFLVFVWLLARYVWPQVRLWLRERHTAVVSELETAAKLREEAERLRAQWAERLARVEQEVAALRQSLLADLERERQRVLAEAEKVAAAIRHDAERQAAAELGRLEEELRAELVLRAQELARAWVRNNWTAADQQRAVEEFLRQVPS